MVVTPEVAYGLIDTRVLPFLLTGHSSLPGAVTESEGSATYDQLSDSESTDSFSCEYHGLCFVNLFSGRNDAEINIDPGDIW